ncbi:hypothetical protein B0H41_000489 [Clostridium beijerinckii]|uniref:Transposase n=2 Tax=Clostridium beijerinckii TaxID=1520 RepID=A0AAX0AUY7_CLOBE|nr:hypothetical protein [Clostridium beijerinckii]
MVRRYGVYSRINNKLARHIVHLYNFVKQRIIESFERNPLLCSKCGTEKFLWKIWHKEYGGIYDIRETSNRKDILYEPKRDKVHRKVLQISLL